MLCYVHVDVDADIAGHFRGFAGRCCGGVVCLSVCLLRGDKSIVGSVGEGRGIGLGNRVTGQYCGGRCFVVG